MPQLSWDPWTNQLSQAAVTKYHGLGQSDNRDLLSLGPRGWKSEIKGPAGLVSPEASLLGLKMAVLLWLHVAVLPYIPIPGVSWSILRTAAILD